MKNQFRRLLAIVLVICMICPLALNAQAATRIDSGIRTTGISLGKLLIGLWDYLWDQFDEPEEPKPEPKPEEPTAPAAGNSQDPGMDLVLVEDQDTVSPMVMMRTSVYEADENDPAAQAELGDNNVVYYPSTFFDYPYV